MAAYENKSYMWNKDGYEPQIKAGRSLPIASIQRDKTSIIKDSQSSSEELTAKGKQHVFHIALRWQKLRHLDENDETKTINQNVLREGWG